MTLCAGELFQQEVGDLLWQTLCLCCCWIGGRLLGCCGIGSGGLCHLRLCDGHCVLCGLSTTIVARCQYADK